MSIIMFSFHWVYFRGVELHCAVLYNLDNMNEMHQTLIIWTENVLDKRKPPPNPIQKIAIFSRRWQACHRIEWALSWPEPQPSYKCTNIQIHNQHNITLLGVSSVQPIAGLLYYTSYQTLSGSNVSGWFSTSCTLLFNMFNLCLIRKPIMHCDMWQCTNEREKTQMSSSILISIQQSRWQSQSILL